MAITRKSKRLLDTYLVQKMNDADNTLSKSTRMRNSGFSEVSVQKNISSIENGVYYNGRVQEVLNKTGSITFSLLDQVAEEVQSEEFKSGFDTAEKVKMLKTFFDINRAVLPTIKQKETKKDGDGNVLSVWTTLN